MIINEQPYGTIHIDVESVEPVTAGPKSASYIKHRAANGWVTIRGTVTKGSSTSRLFHATSTRDRTGERVCIDVPRESYERGSHTFVAM